MNNYQFQIYISILSIIILFIIWLLLYLNYKFKRWEIVKSNGIVRNQIKFNLKNPHSNIKFRLTNYNHKFLDLRKDLQVIFWCSNKNDYLLLDQFSVGCILAQISTSLLFSRKLYIENNGINFKNDSEIYKIFKPLIENKSYVVVVHFGEIRPCFIQFLNQLKIIASSLLLNSNNFKLILLNPYLDKKISYENFKDVIDQLFIKRYLIYSKNKNYKFSKCIENLINILKINNENAIELKLGNRTFKYEETIVFAIIIKWII